MTETKREPQQINPDLPATTGDLRAVRDITIRRTIQLESDLNRFKAQYEMEIERFGAVLNSLAGDMSKLREVLTTFVEGRK